MKVASIFSLLLVSATAFTAPQFATRAVGKAPATKAVAKKAPAKKVVKKVVKKVAAKKVAAKKAPAKKAAPKKKVVAKKAVPKKKFVAKKAPVKKVVAKKAAPKKKAFMSKPKKAFKVKGATSNKPPPASKGYPSFAAKAENFKLGKISGGAAGKTIVPVFVHPTVNTTPPPSFDYKEAAKARKTPQTQEFVYDDGLTVIERKQLKTIPAFLTGSARSKVEAEKPRSDIEVTEYPFGLSGDRFQLLFITIFSLFTLVGCLSGTVSLD